MSKEKKKEKREESKKEELRLRELEEKLNSLSESINSMKEIGGGLIDNNTCHVRMDGLKHEIEELNSRIRVSVSALETTETRLCWIVFILFVAIIALGFISYKTDKTIQELKEEVNTLQNEVRELQLNTRIQSNPQCSQTVAATFIDTVLPMGSKKYHDEKGNTFYIDPDCKYPISNPEFCNFISIEGKDSSGNRLRIYRLTNGDFAYIPSSFSVNLLRN